MFCFVSSFCFGDIFDVTITDVLFQWGWDVFFFQFSAKCDPGRAVLVCATTVVITTHTNCLVVLLFILIYKI